MKKKHLLTALLLAAATLPAAAADGPDASSDPNQKKGEAIITIFTNAHSGFGHANDDRGFDLERAYIGYQYSLPKGVRLKAVIDFAQLKDQDVQRVGYVKTAEVQWKHQGLTLCAGLTSTIQFKTQESFWGKRYILKSFQDEYKFGSSADLGLTAAYRFSPVLSADVAVFNGEGYKKLQIKDGLQYGTGLTLTPARGWTVRAYASYNEAAEKSQKGITNLAAFAGYRQQEFSIGAEYNHQFNTGYTDGQDKSGTSVYATVNANRRLAFFGRWDWLTSKHHWSDSTDGMAGIVGAEFKLGNYIKLSPNFRIWDAHQSGTPSSYYAYLNASFSL